MNEIREKCEKGIFKHYIPLGHGCCLASNLEELGLRDASYPFDWVYSTLSGVELALNTHFKDYLKYDDLYQKKSELHAYKNRNYMITFFHDFKASESLDSQLEKVQEKYDRRITRFYSSVKKPTLFFRYCEDKDEIIKLNEDYECLINTLKAFNSLNELIVIIHDYVTDEEICNISNVFYVEKDAGKIRAERPLSKNKDIFSLLSNALYCEKEHNLEFERQKKIRKERERNSIKSKIRKRINKLMPQNTYIHYQQY